jgi:hypothetical protein
MKFDSKSKSTEVTNADLETWFEDTDDQNLVWKIVESRKTILRHYVLHQDNQVKHKDNQVGHQDNQVGQEDNQVEHQDNQGGHQDNQGGDQNNQDQDQSEDQKESDPDHDEDESDSENIRSSSDIIQDQPDQGLELSKAVFRGQFKIVKKLLEQGADLSEQASSFYHLLAGPPGAARDYFTISL